MSLPSSPTSDCAAAVRYTLGHSAFDLRKRKLDDYSAVGDDSFDFFSSDLTSVRLRRDENLTSTAAVHAPVNGNEVTDHTQSASSSHWSFGSLAKPSPCSSSSATWQRPSELQFFIRLFIGHGIMVFRANFNDTVMSVHERIEELKGIPVVEQRLIYRGKQLQWEKSLADYAIENDSELHLIGRLRSTNHPRAFQLIDELISFVYALVRSNRTSRSQDTACLTRTIDKFFGICPDEVNNDEIHKKSRKDRDARNEDIAGTLELFLESSAPGVLVMLYGSNISENKKLADRTIRYFLSYCSSAVEKSNYRHCAMIALEFCNLLRKFVSVNDGLYVHCRSMLGSFLESVGVCCVEKKGAILLRYVFPFVKELATKLSNNLLNMEPTGADVTDLAVFLIPTCNLLMDRVGPISLSVNMKLSNTSEFYLVSCALELHGIFEELLTQMDKCLLRLEKTSCKKPNVFTEPFPVGACYLAILKVLNDIAKLYKGAEERFWMMLNIRKTVFCALIVKHATRADDNLWLLQHKEVTNFESRRHLATLLFPDVKEDYEEMHEMLIDRSQLLAESFEYIVNAATDALHGGLFMEFKNEEATGPGVLREWFFLVAQDIFNQQNALFLACPNDRRRFFPNPASSVNHMHLEYYTFSGRVIALALMHKVQLGVVFDRVFFLQLAGKEISLEDIRDADPYMYGSCKQILQMDAEFVDADGLGLTFVREVEQLGSKRVVELCPGGENIVVNSRNREQYVNLLIRHCFVTSMAEQKNHFVKGFADILSEPQRQKLFFQSLELEDLDFMLYGSERPICVQDWKAHTEYNGYKETDPQISWFWKIVEKMSHEQRKVLLFFWTSVKFLPVEGFCGLASKLYIYKSSDPNDRLPSSHTCFFRLCFPPYPSMSSMRDRLSIITQEHVGCSFGTW